jgi:uncharacterized tellurite resistance protein B-like protein
MGRPSQFKKIVELWNECVDDLRKANTKKRGGKELDAAAWSALPAELRAEYDHPDQDRWDAVITASPRLAGFHLSTAGELAGLLGMEKSTKLSPAQMKKIATRASEVGLAMEPEPRLRSKGMDWDSDVLVWRDATAELPNAKVYLAVNAMLSLAMTVAMADGVFAPEEQEAVNAFLSEMFDLDDALRFRVEAMKQLMAREPSRLSAVAKMLKETRSTPDLVKIAGVLVAIAAADGTIAEVEEKALRSLYRTFGLPLGDLAAAIAKSGARLERDGVVEVQAPAPASGAVPIPPPPENAPKLLLDHAAIAAIVADTKDVAAILADVFDRESEEPVPSAAAPPPPSDEPLSAIAPPPAPRATDTTTQLAQGLDIRYHAVLEELLQRDALTEAEVKAMAARHRMMPGAIFDTINGWSDDAFGDFLIEEDTGWKINRAIAKAEA